MLLLGVRAEAARRVVLPVFLVAFLSIMAWTPSLRRGKSNSGLDVQDFASVRGARQTGRSGAPSGIDSRRLVTVAAAIQMTRIAGRNAIQHLQRKPWQGFCVVFTRWKAACVAREKRKPRTKYE